MTYQIAPLSSTKVEAVVATVVVEVTVEDRDTMAGAAPTPT